MRKEAGTYELKRRVESRGGQSKQQPDQARAHPGACTVNKVISSCGWAKEEPDQARAHPGACTANKVISSCGRAEEEPDQARARTQARERAMHALRGEADLLLLAVHHVVPAPAHLLGVEVHDLLPHLRRAVRQLVVDHLPCRAAVGIVSAAPQQTALELTFCHMKHAPPPPQAC